MKNSIAQFEDENYSNRNRNPNFDPDLVPHVMFNNDNVPTLFKISPLFVNPFLDSPK